MKSVFKAARSFALGAAACLPLLAPTLPLRAIPEADALKKLYVITVFIITDDKGRPIPSPGLSEGDNQLPLPLFLDQLRAKKELESINKSLPEMKARVTPVPLSVILEDVKTVNSKLQGKKFVPLVISQGSDRDKAVELLRKSGVSEKDITQGLQVPVFFSEPNISINTPKGPKIVFFLSYDDAFSAINQIKDKKMELMVSDFFQVLDRIIKTKDDLFMFYPSKFFIKSVQELQKGSSAP